MDRGYWQKALRQAERELEAARTLTALNAAAKRLMLARRELKLLEHRPRGSAALTVVASRRAPLHDLLGLVDLETRSLQVLYPPVSALDALRSTLRAQRLGLEQGLYGGTSAECLFLASCRHRTRLTAGPH